MFSPTRFAVVLLIALGVVYLYGLSFTGMLGPDEPRYAAIGRAMAHSGDLVTPRLWGSPWFEKPPMVFWTTAAGTWLRLGPEVASRLPVATLGFGFVLFFYLWVRREFGPAEALYTTAVLGTSAGWVTYSYVAVTDVPLAVFFGAAWLLALEWARGDDDSTSRAIAVGALLGLATLAKGLVPLVLFVPFAWPLRRRWRTMLLIAGACLVVAAPWYVLCTMRNGWPFLDELFLKHHFSRFSSGALQHVRPFWFYLPVLLGFVFPWTPLFGLLTPGLFRDRRLRFAGVWVVSAVVFFSAAKNKLPGYLMPVLPPLALLLGLALAWARRTRIPLFLSALLLALAPVVVAVLPGALDVGLSRTPIQGMNIGWLLGFVLFAALPLVLEVRSRRTEALGLVALAACAAYVYVKTVALPVTDRVRPFYRQHAEWLDDVCLQDMDRDARYALQFYTGREIPICEGEAPRRKIMAVGTKLILLD